MANPNPAPSVSARRRGARAGHAPGFGRTVAAIAVLGLALRALYVVALAGDNPGSGDFTFYHSVANLIAQGYGFVDPFALATGREVPTALHPPAWPRLLAVVSAARGTSVEAHRLTGCVVGAGVIVLAGYLGRRVAGPRVGLVTAALAAVYPTLIAADGSLMSETLYGFLVTAALLLAYRMRARPAVGRAAALGAVIGLAALTRSEGLLLAPILGVAAALGAQGRGRRLTLAVVVCLGTVAVVMPWTIRNWHAFGRLVVVSTNGSSVIAGANCQATYYGPSTGGWDLACLPPRRPGLNEAQEAARWSTAGRRYALDHVTRVPVVAVVRVLRTWDLWQPFSQVSHAEGRDRGVELAGVLVYFVLLFPALRGVLVLRRGGQPLVMLLAPAVLATASSIGGYGLMRFRHAAEIPLLVFAAVALVDWHTRRQAVAPAARRDA